METLVPEVGSVGFMIISLKWGTEKVTELRHRVWILCFWTRLLSYLRRLPLILGVAIDVGKVAALCTVLLTKAAGVLAPKYNRSLSCYSLLSPATEIPELTQLYFPRDSVQAGALQSCFPTSQLSHRHQGAKEARRAGTSELVSGPVSQRARPHCVTAITVFWLQSLWFLLWWGDTLPFSWFYMFKGCN